MWYESWNSDVKPGTKRFPEAHDGVGLAMPGPCLPKIVLVLKTTPKLTVSLKVLCGIPSLYNIFQCWIVVLQLSMIFLFI